MKHIKGGWSRRRSVRSRLLLWHTLFYLAYMWIACHANDEDLVTTIDVEVIEGQTACLPCDITPITNDDTVYMVLWFRSTTFGGKPLYIFDVRGRSMHSARHNPDNATFGNRSMFVHTKTPAELQITNIQHHESGIYRCRVDFKNSPTRNYQIRLLVVVPPHRMNLEDENGKYIVGQIGPLRTGENYTVACKIYGGQPKPALQWLVNDTNYDDYNITNSTEMRIESQLTLTNARRSWLNMKVTCLAISTKLSQPSMRMARIQMNLEPTSVTITNKDLKLIEGQETIVSCVVHGSWPPSKIEWYIDNVLYTRGQDNVYNNASSTVSQLYMSPVYNQDGKNMKCQSLHPVLGYLKYDFFVMNVKHKPKVQARLGDTLKGLLLKEGEDIYLECHIEANPNYYWIKWYKNDIEVESDQREKEKRVVISRISLVIRNVSKYDIGLYFCKTANDYGVSRSNVYYLRIYHSPVCAQPTPIMIGASLDEVLRVRCSVDADPDNLTFDWKFNNSKDKFQVSSARFTNIQQVDSMISELRYRAATERDYGTLYCFATNIIGVQREPCVFHIVPASKYATRPTAPRNCSATHMLWRGEDYLSVKCIANFDGGLRQHFTLGIISDKTRVIYNNSDAEYRNRVIWLNMSWSVLESVKEDDVLAVYAHNSRGRSDATPLFGVDLRKPKIVVDQTEDVLGPAEIVIAALMGTAVLIAAIVAAVVFKRYYRKTLPVAV